MKVISWNVNGVRSVYAKGFLEWIKKRKPDVLCLQELKAQEGQISFNFEKYGYRGYFNFAQKKGYSGVAVLTKEEPVSVSDKLGLKRFDDEGRFLRLDFKDFILINLYIPHGGRGKENLEYKLKVYAELLKYLKKLSSYEVILIGDFNIAHRDVDLARPKENRNNIMFTPEERKMLNKLISPDFKDSFREFNPDRVNEYTWWPYFANARERNLGWRIDYVFVTKNIYTKIRKVFILKEDKGSDHCPVGIEF